MISKYIVHLPLKNGNGIGEKIGVVSTYTDVIDFIIDNNIEQAFVYDCDVELYNCFYLQDELKKIILPKLKYFNLKELSALANINYPSLRNFKSNPEKGYLSLDKLKVLYDAMHNIISN